MSRKPRKISTTGIYHVMLRGNERKPVFSDNQDKYMILKLINIKCSEKGFLIYAYCLMDNHVHFLIDTKKQDLSIIMRGIATGYASYYNRKHDRVGHVFQDRYRSEPVENDSYLLALVRYIHNNPVKATLVDTPDRYKWSSYLEYISPQTQNHYIDSKFILDLFSTDRNLAIPQFTEFSILTSDESELNFIENDEGLLIKTIEEGRILMNDYLAVTHRIHDLSLGEIPRKLRDDLIQYLCKNTKLSHSAIAEIIGIDRRTVKRVTNKQAILK